MAAIDMEQGGAWTSDTLAARVARAEARSNDALSIAVADFLLPGDGRLDDRTRLALDEAVRGAVAVLEQAIRRHAARQLAGRDMPERAEAMLTARGDTTERLIRAGLLRDEDIMGELLAGVRQNLIAAALPGAAFGPDAPSLTVRLAAAPDVVVARAAAAVMMSDSRRQDAWDTGLPTAADLPAELHHRLVWWIAAAIRMDGDAEADRAIAEAALRSIAAHDEGERADAVAMRLAVALEPRPAELPDLLVEAIGDRRIPLFTALLAHGCGLPHEAARAITIEPGGDRLWLALRLLDLPRAAIARIGLAFADADPSRDLESFAGQLDAIMTVTSHAACIALAPLTLHHDYRAAIRALARSARR